MAVVGVALIGGGAFAFKFYTAPQRVFGSKALDCAPHEIVWDNENRIEGCGKVIIAVCDEKTCRDKDAPPSSSPPSQF